VTIPFTPSLPLAFAEAQDLSAFDLRFPFTSFPLLALVSPLIF
jgi:hypothetical protein